LRLLRRLPCTLAWEDQKVEAETIDISETGVALRLSPARQLPDSVDITITSRDGRQVELRGRLTRCDVGSEGELSAAVEFSGRTEDQHRRLIELMFSDPLAWSGPHALTMGAPEHVMRVARSVVSVFTRQRLLRRLSPRLRGDLAARVETASGYGAAARTIDISATGAALALETAKQRPPSERLRVTISWNPMERTTVEAEVRSTRTGASGGYVVGVRFVDVTPQQRRDLAKHVHGVDAFGLVAREVTS
jgi:c-di-GMP-binding flagellar brake protein YcgR